MVGALGLGAYFLLRPTEGSSGETPFAEFPSGGGGVGRTTWEPPPAPPAPVTNPDTSGKGGGRNPPPTPQDEGADSWKVWGYHDDPVTPFEPQPEPQWEPPQYTTAPYKPTVSPKEDWGMVNTGGTGSASNWIYVDRATYKPTAAPRASLSSPAPAMFGKGIAAFTAPSGKTLTYNPNLAVALQPAIIQDALAARRRQFAEDAAAASRAARAARLAARGPR